jgi:hypothetical protein
MGARRREPGWDDRFDPITRRKACHHLLPHLVPTRKPIPIPERAAMLAPAHGLDLERFELACCYPRKLPHAQGVKRMGFSYPPSRSIPAGASPCPGADGQSKDQQRLHQLEARRIDRRCVREQRLRLLLDLGMTKLCGGLVPFGLVTRMESPDARPPALVRARVVPVWGCRASRAFCVHRAQTPWVFPFLSREGRVPVRGCVTRLHRLAEASLLAKVRSGLVVPRAPTRPLRAF